MKETTAVPTEEKTTAAPTTSPKPTEVITDSHGVEDGNGAENGNGIENGNGTAVIGRGEHDGNKTDNRTEQCKGIMCEDGKMCRIGENKSPECYCPTDCNDDPDPHCSVFLEDYHNLCEVHRHACRMQINVAVKHRGRCEAYAKGQQISKLVDESFVPINECNEEEILQFAERFLEWAMINKEIYESDDPPSLDLKGLVDQARLLGFTSSEKTEILTFQFDDIDSNGDGFLDKAEVDAMMAHIPHEECLFGFMISSDLDGDHKLNKKEWFDSFKYVENAVEEDDEIDS